MFKWNNNYKKLKEKNQRKVKHLILHSKHIQKIRMKKLKDYLNIF